MNAHATRILPLLMALAAASTAGDLAAQLSVEFRGGAAIGNHAPAAAGLETLPGPSVSASADFQFAYGLGVYALATYGSFQCEEGFCTGQTLTITSTGFGGGIRLQPHRLVWARAGALHHGADVETPGGILSVDPTLGYDLGAGLTVPLGDRVHLVTAVSYRSHPDASDRTSVLSGEAGIRIRLTR